MDLSIGKLQQLVTVARTGSFSRAAQELSISQPALSRSIAAIEDRYGFPIFNRMGHGVQLTVAGAQVIEQARPLLQALLVFDNNIKLFGSGKAGVLSIGMSPLLASQLLARFACEFINSAAKAQLKVMIHPGAVLVESLKSDLIEMFCCPAGYIEVPSDVEGEPLGSMTPVCVVRGGHPLAQRKKLKVADLASFPWASSVDPPISDSVLNPVRFNCDNYHILLEAVLASEMVCICSKDFVADHLEVGTLCEIQVEGLPMPVTNLQLVKLRGRVLSPLAKDAVQRLGTY